ncbi:MAG: VOC family protein [Phycisphaerales bacterium]
MRGPFFHGVGGVLSADIAVPDHERELDFYTQVLTTGSAPLWREDLMNNQGMPVIGLGARTPEYEALPLQWMPHFQVSEVAASAARAIELGGGELLHAKDDDGNSQWAVLMDPAGAAFGLIPVVTDESNGTGDLARVGCISWLSLIAPDTASMSEFYEQVVGWSAVSVDAEGRFEMRRADGAAVAEIRPGADDHEESFASVWILSLPVDDFDESVRQVREAGGEVVKKATGIDHAVIRDPVGVYIALQAG